VVLFKKSKVWNKTMNPVKWQSIKGP
jgi:hypothetical protein